MEHNNTSLPTGHVLLIDKPLNFTSTDVVRKVRRIFQTKKVGHAGTLDPLATGLLIVCVHRQATKQISNFMDMEKEYETTIDLSAFSETDDAQGPIHPVKNLTPPKQEHIEKILHQFIGKQEQMPPIFSALKVNGQRAYALARAGKEVTLEARSITIHSIKLTAYTWPHIKITVRCSKGTYIRSLARDIGKALHTGGYVSQLRRTAIGAFHVKNATTLENLEKSEAPMVY